MSDNRAIGVFDSGLGGLTVVKELVKQLPSENIVYFGDTGRVPYGAKSRDTIRKYALEDEKFLENFSKMEKNYGKSPKRFEAAFHTWFDGLKIIRGIHFLERLEKEK